MESKKTAIDLAGIQAYLAQQTQIRLAYLFGSYARGQADAASDLDIAVLLDPALDRAASVDVQLQTMVALDRITGLESQVVLLNWAAPLLAYQVIHDGVRLLARDSAERINFEVCAMRNYFDIQPMLKFFDQALVQRIQEEGIGRRRRHPESALEAARRVHERLTRLPEY